ncbi:hypothetical protein CCHR01_18092 [Colletotrichum chrysophilum]|uniref:Uncharacterized protein n=1 Tax=Colletotrichum chrysophilum TaxID=1836956 RepID=A0AAD9A2C6_9PEZI|nr:hypothetical protein CCHR01_18092 [Colletotrichum chrysophilum]
MPSASTSMTWPNELLKSSAWRIYIATRIGLLSGLLQITDKLHVHCIYLTSSGPTLATMSTGLFVISTREWTKPTCNQTFLCHWIGTIGNVSVIY